MASRSSQERNGDREPQLTDLRLQLSPCGPSTSPVRREYRIHIVEEEEHQENDEGERLEYNRGLPDNANEPLQVLSSSTVSTLPPTPWASVSFPMFEATDLTVMSRADNF